MAKELPYFKFFCSEWSDGDITLESYEIQGLFINICSYYWSNNCEMTIIKLKKKFKGNDNLINELIDSEIIKIVYDNVYINFLDEQLIEREDSSVKKSLAGKASAEARRLSKLEQQVNTSSTKSQHVLNSCSTESQLLREDKIREDKIRKDISLTLENDFNKFWNIYNKKNDSKKCKDKFIKLPKKDIEKILEVVNDYVVLTPDVQFRKNPLTWLNGKCWNDIEKTEYCPTPD